MDGRRTSVGRPLVIVGALMLAACGIPGETLRFKPDNANIIGVRSALNSTDPVDVVLVHGMCYQDETWVAKANASLAKALDLTITGEPEPIPIGAYGGKFYARELRSAKGEIVRTFAILWSPVSAPARGNLCYDATEKTDSCTDASKLLKDRRVYLNGVLKNEIMDGCLSDAVYSVGKEGIERIGSTIEDGLARALAGGRQLTSIEKSTLAPLANQKAPLFIITESLGSKLFIDAAIRMASRDCESLKAMTATMKRTAQIFMEANQVPMLTLAYDPSLQNKCPSELGVKQARMGARSWEALVELKQSGMPFDKQEFALPLKVAAFSDPNDILSYTLVDAPYLPAGLEVADIVLVNDWPLFGLFENPYAAHTTYRNKCRVRHVIADGTGGLTAPCPPLH